MNKKVTGIILIIMISAFSFMGCGIEDILPGSDDDTEYEESGDISLGMSSVRTLNPVISKDEDTYFISKLLYDGLFELDENMTPQPKLVSEYSFDNESNCLNITLKSDISWHDKENLTAEDVQYSINAYMSAGSKSLYNNHVKNINSVSVNNERSLSVYYNSGENISLALLTFPILPLHQYGDVSALLNESEDFRPVGTGPYQCKKYDSSASLELSANEQYFDEVAENTITFKILPKKSYEYNLIESGNLTVIFSERQDRYAKISNAELTKVDFPSRTVEYVGFNSQKNATGKAEMRKAIAYAIDTKTILEESYYNSGILSDSIYYPGYLGVENKEDAYKNDDSKAVKQLEKLGYKDEDEDGILEDQEGNALELEIVVNSDNASRVNAAKTIEDNLDNLRFDAYVTECSESEYKSRLRSGNYDIYIGGYEFDEDFDARPLLDNVPTNYTKFTNEELSQLLNELKSGVDNETAAETYSQIKEILNDELPYYCLFYKSYGAIQSPQLDGEVTPLFNNYYRGCQNWICKYEVKPEETEEENIETEGSSTQN